MRIGRELLVEHGRREVTVCVRVCCTRCRLLVSRGGVVCTRRASRVREFSEQRLTDNSSRGYAANTVGDANRPKRQDVN